MRSAPLSLSLSLWPLLPGWAAAASARARTPPLVCRTPTLTQASPPSCVLPPSLARAGPAPPDGIIVQPGADAPAGERWRRVPPCRDGAERRPPLCACLAFLAAAPLMRVHGHVHTLLDTASQTDTFPPRVAACLCAEGGAVGAVGAAPDGMDVAFALCDVSLRHHKFMIGAGIAEVLMCPVVGGVAGAHIPPYWIMAFAPFVRHVLSDLFRVGHDRFKNSLGWLKKGHLPPPQQLSPEEEVSARPCATQVGW